MDAFTLNQYTTKIADFGRIGVAPTTVATATSVLAATGRIYSATIAAAGSGYDVGDVLTVAAPGSGGTFTVNTVDGSGAVTGVSLTTAGTGYANVTGAATTVAPSGGTGATLTTVCEFALDGAQTVTAAGSGYVIASVSIATTNGSGGVLTATLSTGEVDSIAVTTGGWYRVAPLLTITGIPHTGAQLVTVLKAYDLSLQDDRLKEILVDSQFVNVGNPTSAATVKAAIAAL